MKINSIDIDNNKKSIALFFLLLITSLAPFSMATSFHDSQRLIATLVITIILIIRLVADTIFSKETLRFIFTILAWGAYVSTQSLAYEWSLVEVSLFFSVSLTILVIFKTPSLWLLTKLALIFTAIQLVYIVADYINYALTLAISEKLNVWEIIDGFSNIRFYAQFLSWTLPFLIGFVSTQEKPNFQKFITAIIILSWTLALVSGTRAFILGMTFSLLSVFIITPNLWRRYATWTLLTGLAGIIGYIMLVLILPNVFGLDNNAALNSTIDRDFTNSSGRIRIWIDTLNVAMSHPYTGIGPMMTAMEGILGKVAHPHNFLLQLMAEWGIPFTVGFMALTIYLSLKWRKLISENPAEREILALPVTAAISSAIAAGLVDGVMVMPVSLLYMTIIFGFGAALWRAWTPQVQRFRLPIELSSLLLIPVLSLAIITTIQWINIAQSNQGLSSAFTPRFWLNGKISQDNEFLNPTQTKRHNVVLR
ncbi:O-antigen ligase family protein [Thiothrix litoralis]|uniref:O-antigen ligase family protein n=1 Tax=Thiothrix litoralis TaxID=2891210 RepID=A0ABX7WUD4_9GAMM|nr:O-antigen ligase family protein [Thiothrix litoralis]QTR46078.1 O-antigen ligase family protein [Thiothrix litoralis]